MSSEQGCPDVGYMCIKRLTSCNSFFLFKIKYILLYLPKNHWVYKLLHSYTYESVMYVIWTSTLQSNISYNYYANKKNMKRGTAEDSEFTVLTFMPICLGLSLFLLLQRLL